MIRKINKNKGTTFKVVSLLDKQHNFPWRLFFYIILTILVTYTFSKIFNIFPLSIRGLGNIILFPLWLYIIYKIWKRYFKFRNKTSYEKQLKYFLKANHFYENENIEYETTGKDGRIKKEHEKIIVTSARLGYFSDDEKIIIRAYKDANIFTDKMEDIDTGLSALLGMEIYKKNNTITFCDYYFEKVPDNRLNLSDMPKQRGTIINVTSKISYDVSKVSHGLTVGGTGSGKSFYINSKILDYARMGSDIYIADPKSADLSLLRFIDGFENHVASNPNHIAKMLREINEVMEQRYRDNFSDVSAFGKTFVDFGLSPVVLIFDEFAAFMKSADKKLSTECMNYLYNIILKGRASGVFVELILQRPDASILDGAIRDQLGCRVALGSLSRQGYEMIFGTSEIEYKTVMVKGGGYVKIDGLHNDPTYFETPFLEKDFDFIEELKKYK